MKYFDLTALLKDSKKSTKKREKYFVKAVLIWGEGNLREFSWRNKCTPYKTFIAEILLKRTTSTAVNNTYRNFLKKFPDINSIYSSEIKKIEVVLKPIGLYKQRSRGLKEAAENIVRIHSGDLPNKYEELIKIPHIGAYTAGAIISFGYNKPESIVDSNIRRIINKVFSDILNKNRSDKNIKEFLNKLIPKRKHRLFNWSLIDLGAMICSYRFQKCVECPLNNVCFYFWGKKNTIKKEAVLCK